MSSQVMTPEMIGTQSTQKDVTASWVLRFLPSLSDLAFLLPIAFLFFVLRGPRTLLTDGDTGWHIRAGDWILKHGQVPYKDLFSFSMPDANWFAWEWGWDVLFSLIHAHGGLGGVVLANVIVLGLMGVSLYRLVRRNSCNDLLAFALTAVAVAGSSLHWLARPHLVSWLFVIAFLHIIDRAEGGRRQYLWLCPVLTLFWVNLHGSFFLGIALLFTYALGNVARSMAVENGGCLRIALEHQRGYWGAALACCAVTFVNPYGWHLHEHVWQYLLDSEQLQLIGEYASLSFQAPLSVCFEAFVVLGAWAAFDCFRQGRWGHALTLLFGAHLGLKSARNVPIFLFMAAPAVAAVLSACLLEMQRGALKGRVRRVVSKLTELGADFRSMERVERLPLMGAGVIVLAGLGLAQIADFDARDFPVKAAATVLAQKPQARIFTFEQWGDYLIYRFPERRVFADGRSDMYGTQFVKKWVNAVRADFDWNTELSNGAIDTVLLRTTNALASVLKQSSDWRVVFDDGVAIVFEREKSSDAPTTQLKAVFKSSSGQMSGRKNL